MGQRETHRRGIFTMATSIRCTLPNCSCECFAPGKSQLRTCEQCRHGWIAHAMDKLATGHAFPSLLVEVVHSDIAFDIASLMLYGTQAAPVRLRILLDRLFSVLKSEEVDRILQGLGWGQEDYARGYVLQDQDGKVLQHWSVATREEEVVILNQFLRFGETKSIAEVMLQELQAGDSQSVQKKNESDIRAFIERISGRNNANSTFDVPDVEILPSASPPSRTLAKPLQTNEGPKPGKTPQSGTQRETSHDSTVPAHNIHLANLEQTVLKAGVVQPTSSRSSRTRTASLNSSLPTLKRSPAAQILTPDERPASGSSAPTFLSSSVSMFSGTPKRFTSFSFKGHRKMALSKRRNWAPFSSLANSKQVKCNTCNKWFYDKGTWKIHFGAVHLKVKYRCKVEGCNMAFSSLRSRNRHSSNPNPRIHRFVHNRRINKRRGSLQREELQLQLEDRGLEEQGNDIGAEDVTMVTDDVTILSEEEKKPSSVDGDGKALVDEKDTLTEAQAKKIRKRGTKEGTPCRYARCECGDYESPAGALRNSWLATCTSCRHSESEHRVPTKHDKTREANLEKAPGRSCVGCDVECQGYIKPEPSSVPLDSPLAKQCTNCKHTIDCHRPETELDKLIKTTFTGCTSLPCHVHMDRDDKQMTSLSINESDDAEIGVWFEPTNIDPDEDEGIVTIKICRCRGFRLDNLSRICQKYYSFTANIVTPFLAQTPCQRCSHTLDLHRLPNNQEKSILDAKKWSNLSLSGVVTFSSADNLASQEAIDAILLPSNSPSSALPQLALARVESSAVGAFSIIVTLCPASLPGSQDADRGGRGEGGGGGRKRKKVSQILKDVKQKIKRRKTSDGAVGSSDGESPPDEVTDASSGDIGFPGNLLRTLAKQVKGQVVIQCGGAAPTALVFCVVELKRRKTVLLLAAGNADGSVAIHMVSGSEDCQSLDIEGAMQCPTSSVSKLALSASQNTLLCGHTDGTLAVWTWDLHAKTMELVATRTDRRCRVSALSVATGRKYVAVGYHNGDVLLYEASERTLPSPRKGKAPQPGPSSATTTTTTSYLKLISSCSIAYGAVTSLAWHPGKIIVAAGGEDDNVTVFYMYVSSNAKSGTRRTIMQYFSPKKHLKPNTFYKCAVLKGHKSFVSNVTFDPRGWFLLSTGWDGQVLFWSAGEVDDIIKIGDSATTMESSSGFILGQNQRTQKGTGTQGGGCPFVPLWAGVTGEGAFVLLRSSPAKVHLAGYELPKKIVY